MCYLKMNGKELGVLASNIIILSIGLAFSEKKSSAVFGAGIGCYY
jgi:hypothetical protein